MDKIYLVEGSFLHHIKFSAGMAVVEKLARIICQHRIGFGTWYKDLFLH